MRPNATGIRTEGQQASQSPSPLPRSAHPLSALPSAMSPAEEVLADYRTVGLSLRAHPLEFLRAELDAIGRRCRRRP